MVRETRIQHRTHCRVAPQQLHHRLGAGAVAVHAHAQCLHAAQRQVAVERARHCPHGVLGEHQVIGQLVVVGGHEAAHHVAVPADVLGGRMHHSVGAERQRLLQVGRGERVVHHHDAAELVRDGADGFDVEDREQRVGGRLEPHHAGLRRPGIADLLRRGEVHRSGLDAGVAMHLVDQPERAAVGVVAQQQAVAGPQHPQQRVLRCQPAGECEPVSGAFQRGHAGLIRVTGRVARAPVLVAVPRLPDRLLSKRRSQRDRRHHRTRVRIVRLPRPDRPRLEPELVRILEPRHLRLAA